MACGFGFMGGLPYPWLVLICIVYSLFVQGDSAALHTGVVQMADPKRRGTTMAVQSLMGFACAFVGPLTVGAVLDAVGGGKTILSWGAAFMTMGFVVALGPVFLRKIVSKS